MKARGLTLFKFPPSYRKFLGDFGFCNINGLEIYGIIDSNFVNSTVPNGIWLTISERSEGNIGNNSVIIGASEDEGWIIIDTAVRDTEGESPVQVLSLDASNREILANSFGEYLLVRSK